MRILIVDDHPAVGEGTKAMLQEEQFDVDVMVSAGDVLRLIKEENECYDLFLFDLYMPEMNGLELTKHIRRQLPDAIVLIYTGFDIHDHFNMVVEAGASGFLSKTASKAQLLRAIYCALDEEAVLPLSLFRQLRKRSTDVSLQRAENEESLQLNGKERSILEHVYKGQTNREIALELHMSQRTVEHHLTKVFQKLSVRSRTEAMLRAKELGLLNILS
ncbi:response regulator transcription factor [Bacillaceae bacterium SIJ1]|uniref:response regulator transcription factor n=1 Tax=Litoribacterium kuwaitense TaxID=1398745 RepID=UPI0013EE0E4E|nr:response regulator transcription factor [Litoribacterium kuwaitense]NGP43944.1 response regulator transcription factor [Litoribacterium kuwaitense]